MSSSKMGSNNNKLVKLKNAGYQQDNKWLVKGVSLEVEKGKIVTLIGPNGSGKSTTAKIALGIYKKFDGEENVETEIDLNVNESSQEQTFFEVLPLLNEEFVASGMIENDLFIAG